MQKTLFRKLHNKLMVALMAIMVLLCSAISAFADDSDISALGMDDPVTISYEGHTYTYDRAVEAQKLEELPISPYRTGQNYASRLGYTIVPLNTRYGDDNAFIVAGLTTDGYMLVMSVVRGEVVYARQMSSNARGFVVGRTEDDRYIVSQTLTGGLMEAYNPPRENYYNFDFTLGYNAVYHANEFVADVELYSFPLRIGYALQIDTGSQSLPYLVETGSYRSFSLLGSNYRGVSVINSNAVVSAYNLKNSNSQIPFHRVDKYNGNYSAESNGSRYLYIINPVYYGDINEVERSQTVYVTITQPARSVRVIPLTIDSYFSGTIDSSSGGGIVTNTGSVITENADGTTSSAIYVQTDGGNSPQFVPRDNTTVIGVIKDAVSSIQSMFIDASEAIANLVNGGGQFVSDFVQIFDFLPAPILGTFMSAVVVIIIIGVLKVFL